MIEEEDAEPDADEEWWIRKGHGAALARHRWRYDRRPDTVNSARRHADPGRVIPSWEYECGWSSVGYYTGNTDGLDDEEEDPDEEAA